MLSVSTKMSLACIYFQLQKGHSCRNFRFINLIKRCLCLLCFNLKGIKVWELIQTDFAFPHFPIFFPFSLLYWKKIIYNRMTWLIGKKCEKISVYKGKSSFYPKFSIFFRLNLSTFRKIIIFMPCYFLTAKAKFVKRPKCKLIILQSVTKRFPVGIKIQQI